MPVKVEKDRVSPFTISEERLVDSVGLDLLVELLETEEVVFGAFHGVGDHGSRLHDKGPVTGLGEKELPGSLAEGAVLQRIGMSIFKFSS